MKIRVRVGFQFSDDATVSEILWGSRRNNSFFKNNILIFWNLENSELMFWPVLGLKIVFLTIFLHPELKIDRKFGFSAKFYPRIHVQHSFVRLLEKNPKFQLKSYSEYFISNPDQNFRFCSWNRKIKCCIGILG